MHEKLKERLFGGVVIVSLGVIFIPMLFERPLPKAVDGSHPLPPSPDWSADSDVEVPDEWLLSDVDTLDNTKSVVFNLPADITAAARKEKIQAFVRASDDAAAVKSGRTITRKAWSVQVASFTDNVRARELEKELKRNGYPAYHKEVTEGSQQVTRILVGPELESSEAENLKGMLNNRFKLEGIVVPYDPIAG